MRFDEFYLRLKAIAGRRHFSAHLGASPFGLEWSAYIAGPGYTASHNERFPAVPSDPVQVLGVAERMLAAHIDPAPEPVRDPDLAELADVSEPHEPRTERKPGDIVDGEFPEVGEPGF